MRLRSAPLAMVASASSSPRSIVSQPGVCPSPVASCSCCVSTFTSSVRRTTSACTLDVLRNVSTCFCSCLIFSLHLIILLLDSSSCCFSLTISASLSSESVDFGNSDFGPLVFSFSCSTDTFAAITFASIVFSSSACRNRSISSFIRFISAPCEATRPSKETICSYELLSSLVAAATRSSVSLVATVDGW
uniref:Putative retinitis pigmentosa gtpase regulator b n=1 Tax=Anopheles darlingi TaxID=43151 RepID=A0A2M4CJT9_ANODA